MIRGQHTSYHLCCFRAIFRAINEIGILVTALQQESRCPFAKERARLPIQDIHNIGHKPLAVTISTSFALPA